jgi:hypothetical protein
MPITTVHCPVSHADVVRVTDFEGTPTRVVCPEFDEPTEACRLKMRASAEPPLTRLLERVDEGTLDVHDARCQLA